jgi:hypothetical protein
MAGQSTRKHNQKKGHGHQRKQTWPPPIPFTKPEETSGGEERAKETEDNLRPYKLKLRNGGEDEDSTYTLYIRQFEFDDNERNPEDWCVWRTAMDGLFSALGYSEDQTEDRQQLFYANLGPLAQEAWQGFVTKRFGKENVEPSNDDTTNNIVGEENVDATTDGEVDQREECKKKKKRKKKEIEIREKDNYQRRKTVALAQVLNDMALEIFTDGERAARLQRKYLCHMGLMMDGIRVETFIRRLKQISNYLPYFPMRLVNGRLVQPEPFRRTP